MPRVVAGIPIRSILFNRAICTALPPYYTSKRSVIGRGTPTGIAAALVRPLKRVVWWTLEKASKSVYKLKGDRVPTISLPEDLFVLGQVTQRGVTCNLQVEIMRCEHVS